MPYICNVRKEIQATSKPKLQKDLLKIQLEPRWNNYKEQKPLSQVV